ncbi:MAG: hypothetical protein M1339_04485 [Bacteroidetes bacterium]|nr:hypothetical protein [Bacteroidota bacterium]
MERRKRLAGGLKRVIISVAVCVVFAAPAFGQVHIQEKAVITPLQMGTVSSVNGITTHTIRLEFSWSGSPEGRLDYMTPCMNGQPVTSDSTINFTISPAPAGAYLFELSVEGFWNYFMTANYSWKLSLDGAVVESDSGSEVVTAGTPDVPAGWASVAGAVFFYHTPYNSTFELSFETNQLLSGDTTGLSLKGVNDCSGTAWLPTDAMTLTIVSGSQDASFYQTGSGADMGSVVTTTGKDAGQYSLVANGATPDSNGDWVFVQAASDGITKTDSVQILQKPDHFFVYAYPDTVVHSQYYPATINVQAKNSAGNDISIPGDTPLNIVADDSGTYGEVLDPFSNYPYPYSDASNGNIGYAANGQEPGGIQKVAITVTENANSCL